MGVTSSQKVSPRKKGFYSWESQEERSCVPRLRQRLNAPESICRHASRVLARQSTDSASSHQGAQEGENLCQALRAFHGVRLHAIRKASVLDVESQSIAGSYLPFFRGLALSKANRAGQIAFANCFPDGKKFWLTMQMRGIRNVIQLVILILRYCDHFRDLVRIGSAPWPLRVVRRHYQPSGRQQRQS